MVKRSLTFWIKAGYIASGSAKRQHGSEHAVAFLAEPRFLSALVIGGDASQALLAAATEAQIAQYGETLSFNDLWQIAIDEGGEK